jgi:hypothetical protein
VETELSGSTCGRVEVAAASWEQIIEPAVPGYRRRFIGEKSKIEVRFREECLCGYYRLANPTTARTVLLSGQ